MIGKFHILGQPFSFRFKVECTSLRLMKLSLFNIDYYCTSNFPRLSRNAVSWDTNLLRWCSEFSALKLTVMVATAFLCQASYRTAYAPSSLSHPHTAIYFPISLHIMFYYIFFFFVPFSFFAVSLWHYSTELYTHQCTTNSE